MPHAGNIDVLYSLSLSLCDMLETETSSALSLVHGNIVMLYVQNIVTCVRVWCVPRVHAVVVRGPSTKTLTVAALASGRIVTGILLIALLDTPYEYFV